MTTGVSSRVPQEERTRAMRARLLEATIDCLVENGWSGTSTTLISERAGVSRGAQLHHFPSKQALVFAAVEHLAVQRGEEMASATLPEGPGRTRTALEVIAGWFVSPLFTAALELWVAARTEPELHAEVLRLEERIGRETHRAVVALLGVDERQSGARAFVQGLLDMMRGLGLANTLGDDKRRRKKILDGWALLVDDYLLGKGNR